MSSYIPTYQPSSKRNRPYLIGIAGGSGSGKTSVANRIFKFVGIHNCLLFSMDTYYKDLTDEQQEKISEYNFDTPEALDLNLLSYHLSELMSWRPIQMPTYDFAESKRRKDTITITPNKIILFEGILAFHDKRMRDLMDMKIFVDLDGDIRLARRIYRDIIERGREMTTVIERYHKFVKPAYETYIKPTKNYADIIIPYGAENTITVDLVSQYLKKEITKLFPDKINKIDDGEKDKISLTKEIEINKVKKLEEELFKYCEDKEDGNMINRINIPTKNDDRKMLVRAFEYFISGKKHQYYDVFMNLMINVLMNWFSNKRKRIKVIFPGNKALNFEYNELINDVKEENTVIIFSPIEIELSEELRNCIVGLNQRKIKKVQVFSIYICKETIDILNKFSKNDIIFYTVYCGGILKRFKSYIEKGGFFGADFEGEYSDNIGMLTKDNFENAFSKKLTGSISKFD